MENNKEFNLDVRDLNELDNAFKTTENILTKNYLRVLSKLEIEPVDYSITGTEIEKKSRFFKINKLVYNKNEDSLDKLTTVFNSVSVSSGSIATIVKSDGKNVDYYIGVINKKDDGDILTQYETLEGTFKGNFPGSNINSLRNCEIKSLISDIFKKDDEFNDVVVSSVSGVAALRLEENKDISNYIQGLEKLTDSMKDKCYTIILIADPVTFSEVNEIKVGYEQLYSQLVPFQKTQMTFNEGDSLTLTEGETKGVTNTINNSISYTQNHAETNGWSASKSEGSSKTTNYGGALQGVVSLAGTAIGATAGAVAGPLGIIAGGAIGKAAGSIAGSLIGSSTSSTNISNTKSGSTSDSIGKTEQSGESESISNQKNNNVSEGITTGRSIQISYENRTIKSMIEKIDLQLDRLKKCEDFGTFNLAAYFISNDTSVNKIAASSYNALMRGEDASIETSVINSWTSRRDNRKICRYLEKLTHPTFRFDLNKEKYIKVTPATIVSGKELSIQLALPKKSISGLPVVEAVEFGRNIYTLSSEQTTDEIKLGNIYHMGESECETVNLDKKSLSMHTFITGSTGAGKSNTVYKMIDELNKNNVKVLVVEPAKGEYKHVFGHRNDVTVLGTNPNFTDLLKINPFKFADSIHVLEHIDKLIEIFNVCWPMYAAMPAILKEAVEKAYVIAGWDLSLSINKNNTKLYPTFMDLVLTLNEVIKDSSYSEELKGNYIGALVTRVKSLTNGINGIIFASDEVDNSILFDSNVIVDLSRVGSTETKSMIMGILIMRLQEHRMDQGGMNNPLKHVTVLEEAHNILKKSSMEQSSEGSNLVGKSVEMISNSIAEMRTYGEGFIIVDQSPGIIDMSAIRNTNTKIILRLPEQSDRETVGKSIGLTDEQINEISKLDTGVAAVYQNNWLESVLCKVDRVELSEKEYKKRISLKQVNSNKELKKYLTQILLSDHIGEEVDYDIDSLERTIIQAKFTSRVKMDILEVLKSKEEKKLSRVSKVINTFYAEESVFEKAKCAENFNRWNEIVLENIDDIVDCLDEDYRNSILQCILREKAKAEESFEKFYFDWTDYMRGKII